MATLKKGDDGDAVKSLQKQLNAALGVSMPVDGDFGSTTEKYVKKFQKSNGLVVDGVAGKKTLAALSKSGGAQPRRNFPLYIKPQFIVFVDAGHGGMDDDGDYTTGGKRAFHKGESMHDGKGWYFEGYENHVVSEMFIAELARHGIVAVRTYHPFRDTSLGARAELVRAYLRRGAIGYMHSFHSNAISESNSKQKLEATRGFSVYTSRGTTFSDEIANQHWDNVRAEFGDAWRYRSDVDAGEQKGDGDKDRNFTVLSKTDLDEFNDTFGSILEEFGFHTSKTDTKFIMANRDRRVKCAVKTALWVRDKLMANV